MSLATEVVRFIHEETALSEASQRALVSLVRRHPNNIGKMTRWIKSMASFTGADYCGLSSFQRVEVLKCLTEGLLQGKNRRSSFMAPLSIFLCGDADAQEEEVFRTLSFHILERLRGEKQMKPRACLVELLIRLLSRPPAGLRIEDLLGGLHHDDEVIRCRTLMFLYEHFKAEGIRWVFKVVKEFDRPPSLLFWGTLRHLVHQHPEILKEADYRSLFGNELGPSFSMSLEEKGDINRIGHRHPGWRLGIRVACLSIDPANKSNGRERAKALRGKSLRGRQDIIRSKRFEFMGFRH